MWWETLLVVAPWHQVELRILHDGNAKKKTLTLFDISYYMICIPSLLDL